MCRQAGAAGGRREAGRCKACGHAGGCSTAGRSELRCSTAGWLSHASRRSPSPSPHLGEGLEQAADVLLADADPRVPHAKLEQHGARRRRAAALALNRRLLLLGLLRCLLLLRLLLGILRRLLRLRLLLRLLLGRRLRLLRLLPGCRGRGRGRRRAAALLLLGPYLQQHLPPLCELDTVAEDVEQDLLQALRVAYHHRGDCRGGQEGGACCHATFFIVASFSVASFSVAGCSPPQNPPHTHHMTSHTHPRIHTACQPPPASPEGAMW